MSQQLDSLDIKLLQMLSANARKPYLEIARETGVSGAAIHQRMAKLQALGIVRGSETIIDPTSIGYTTCAYIGVRIDNVKSYDEISSRLKQIPEIIEAHLTTGQYDMIIKVYARNNEHLLNVILNKIHSLNLGRSETIISFKELFKRQLPIEDSNLL